MIRKMSSNVCQVVQNPCNPEPEDSSSSMEDLCEWTGEWYEQPTLFAELGVEDLFAEEPAIQRGGAKWYTQKDLDEGALILEILKDSETLLTKRDLAIARYPQIFLQMSSHVFQDPLGRNWNISKEIQKRYISAIGHCLRSINDNINRTLDSLKEDRLQQLAYLEKVALAMPIGQDSQGRALYVYHGPGHQQPPEIIEKFQAWAEKHKARNGRLKDLASHLSNSSSHAGHLDNEDYPDWHEDGMSSQA